jgi:hypothetical protein
VSEECVDEDVDARWKVDIGHGWGEVRSVDVGEDCDVHFDVVVCYGMRERWMLPMGMA